MDPGIIAVFIPVIAIFVGGLIAVASIMTKHQREMAEKFQRPLLTFVDTPGAYPGKGAEERGQAEAIATNLRLMSRLTVPVVVTVTGEGGSGGALAIAVGDRVLMLEHAVYSVISPEGCAAILWSDQGKAPEAARAMKISATDLRELDVVDAIVPEPPGGAQADPPRQAEILDGYLMEAMERNMPDQVSASGQSGE